MGSNFPWATVSRYQEILREGVSSLAATRAPSPKNVSHDHRPGDEHGHRLRLTRLDANRVRVENPQGIDALLFANEKVPVESAAVTELLEMLQLQATVERFADTSPGSFDEPPRIDRVAITPDFHKARGIPVGTVLATRGFVMPQAIGNDINCGMRLHLTSLQAEDLRASWTTWSRHPAHLLRGGPEHSHDRASARGDVQERPDRPVEATPRTCNEGLWGLFHELDVERELRPRRAARQPGGG